MPGTTVPVAKRAVEALLRAHTWTGGTPDILRGPPTEGDDSSAMELIYLAGTTVTVEARALGLTRHDESYPLRIVIDVRMYGDDEAAAEDRSWALYDQLAELLRVNPTLSGTVNRQGNRTARQENVPNPSMWRSQIVVDQDVVGLVYY